MKITFTTYNAGQPNLLISASELLERHFWGLPTCDSRGNEISVSVIEQKLMDAQIAVELHLGIKFKPQIIRESLSYNYNEFQQYGFLKATYNVQKPYLLQGYYNTSLQMSVPTEWLSTRTEVSSQAGATAQGFKNVFVIPVSGGVTTTISSQPGVIYGGAFSIGSMRNSSYVPNYWYLTYATGFDKIPNDLVVFIEKLAAIQIFAQLGDVYLGVGISNKSISLDGLSQTVSTTRNSEGGVFNSRIKQYLSEMAGDIDALVKRYRGIVFDVL